MNGQPHTYKQFLTDGLIHVEGIQVILESSNYTKHLLKTEENRLTVDISASLCLLISLMFYPHVHLSRICPSALGLLSLYLSISQSNFLSIPFFFIAIIPPVSLSLIYTFVCFSVYIPLFLL